MSVMDMATELADFELSRYLRRANIKPDAYARIKGSAEYPAIRGMVLFYGDDGGTWVHVEIKGLPLYQPAATGSQPIGPFGFHIHNGGSCTPLDTDTPFERTMGHYNPTGQPHGNHTGDFPVLFSNNGFARMSFFTNKFKPKDVIGKTVVIHLNPDDYRTQPAGNSGKKIACGVIVKD